MVIHPGAQAAASYLTPEKAAYWDGRDLHGEPIPSGAYFYRLDAGDFTATRKMVVVKSRGLPACTHDTDVSLNS
ncbi:hypothetical protein HYR99_08585 [Candidatus Poribacteria bacterium]|nr:hypothetical protein [Candidatus Poribacteria bacterium]